MKMAFVKPLGELEIHALQCNMEVGPWFMHSRAKVVYVNIRIGLHLRVKTF